MVQSDSGKCRKDIINGMKLSAIIDSGSDLSLICEEQYKQIGSLTLGNRTIKFRGACSGEITTLGDTRLKICIDMEIYDIIVHLVHDGTFPHGMLIGSDFLNNVEVHMKRGIVNISKIENDPAILPEVYKIVVVQDDKIVDLSHIKDECIKKEVECLVKKYKPEKREEVGIKMSIIVKDVFQLLKTRVDYPWHRRQKWIHKFVYGLTKE